MAIDIPVHASWLNQVEIFFSILQRKVLTPANSCSMDELAQRILAFQASYAQIAQPFEWRFTRSDLRKLLARLPNGSSRSEVAA